jgi:hypothetical protein
MCTGYKHDAVLLCLPDRLFVTVKLNFRSTNHAACCKIHVAPVPLSYIPRSVQGSGHGKANWISIYARCYFYPRNNLVLLIY